MSNGIFEVQFQSNRPDSGGGLVVVKDGSVNGGDAHYLYQGQIPAVTGPFTANFKVSMWKPGNTNVAGFDDYTLDASGNVDYEAGTISLEGTVVGESQIKITLNGKKITDAV